MSRILAISWAIGLGLLAGAIAGTLVPATSPGEEIRQVAGLSIVFVPAIYILVTRRWDTWSQRNQFLRFAIFLLSFIASAGLLMILTVLVVGSSGAVAAAMTVLAAGLAFAITAWVSFFGGADRIWTELIDRGWIDV